MHYVYVLRSARDDGLYIGYSANLRRRFIQHCEGTVCATGHRRPWTLIYYEAYLDPADAPTLVVITPHVEQLREEFARGFDRWHVRTHGAHVAIDWRTPGGTSDIMRLIVSRHLSL